MTDTNKLNDTELKNVSAGGRLAVVTKPIVETPDVKWIYNSRGNYVGHWNTDGSITYWKCTHCNGPVHRNTFYFCDKCDDWWISRADYTWYGTEAELIAAAN